MAKTKPLMHIFLLEHPNPKGRYNFSECMVTFKRISKLFSSHSSSKQIEGIRLLDLSSKKLIDAGFMYKYELNEMLHGSIKCCKEKGFPVR
ncbi:hypothetical protein AAZX31_05G095700 [Glycine max]